MAAAGIIAEYNPLHRGHTYQLRRLRALLGEETPVICAMSGNFVQRGDFALLPKHARAEAAVRSGADLVLEIPLSWACAPAERFAQGGVEVLLGTGLVTDLVFGSESADAGAIRRAADALQSPDFPETLRRELAGPCSFAAARQRALAGLIGEEGAAVLSRPNDILAVEYAKALLREGREVPMVPILRQGAGHDEDGGDCPSAGSIRRMLQEGRRAEALAAMAPAMRELYEAEEAQGRAPVFAANAERAKAKGYVAKSNTDEAFRPHIAKVEENDDALTEEPEIADGDFVLGVRPEFISMSGESGIDGEIYGVMPTGMECTLKIRVGEFLLTSVAFGSSLFAIGTKSKFSFTGSDIMLFDRKSGRRIVSGRLEIK